MFEDDRTYAFEDVNPQAPTHVVVVPKKHISELAEAQPTDADLVGHCYLVAARIAQERKIEDTLRTVATSGRVPARRFFTCTSMCLEVAI